MSRTTISLFVAAAIAGAVVAARPATAALTFGPSGVCPTTFGHAPFGGGNTGTATDCNLFITFNANGSITTTAGPQTTFDGVEDALIGVVNNSSTSVTTIHLAGSNIGRFDGDGINGYANGGPIPANARDTTGYGGASAFFTNNTVNALDVTFIGGIAPGATGYFSLEEPASLSLQVTNPVPEPATLAMLGASLLGLAAARRRRS